MSIRRRMLSCGGSRQEQASNTTGHGVPASSGGTAQESAARAKTTGHHPLTDGQVEDARQALVTGYAEYRASLQDKKQYRRAIKIDLKLPEAAAAFAGPPRRKGFGEKEHRLLAKHRFWT